MDCEKRGELVPVAFYVMKGSIEIGKYEDQFVFDLDPEYFVSLYETEESTNGGGVERARTGLGA